MKFPLFSGIFTINRPKVLAQNPSLDCNRSVLQTTFVPTKAKIPQIQEKKKKIKLGTEIKRTSKMNVA